MSEAFYYKEAMCPICNTPFKTRKIKSSACYVDTKDTDFCTYYKTVNPTFYEILVCPVCAYSASENSFNELTDFEKTTLMNAFSGRTVNRNFCEERSVNDAIDSFKLALFTANKRKAKNSILGGICLKLAWLYRMAGDQDNEKNFMKFALENYTEAFSVETMPLGNMSEMTVLYLLGELSRRLEKFDDAVYWFGKAIASPERNSNPRIERMTRDQWAIAKEQYKTSKEAKES